MTLEAQLLARACGKTNIHSLEPEDLAALTMEASALAKVPLTGTNHTVGVDEAVTNPQPGLDSLTNLTKNIECILNTILSHFSWVVFSVLLL